MSSICCSADVKAILNFTPFIKCLPMGTAREFILPGLWKVLIFSFGLFLWLHKKTVSVMYQNLTAISNATQVMLQITWCEIKCLFDVDRATNRAHIGTCYGVKKTFFFYFVTWIVYSYWSSFLWHGFEKLGFFLERPLLTIDLLKMSNTVVTFNCWVSTCGWQHNELSKISVPLKFHLSVKQHSIVPLFIWNYKIKLCSKYGFYRMCFIFPINYRRWFPKFSGFVCLDYT